MTRTMTTIMALLISLPLYAVELKLGKITSDIDRDFTDFYLEVTEEGAVDGIRIITQKTTGQIIKDVSHPIERVMQDGVLLEERNGYQVLRLQTDAKFDPSTGGEVILNYLFNGVTGTRRSMRLKLLKTAGTFQLAKLTSERVNHLHVRGNYNVLLGLVGIFDITPSYQ